MGMQYIEFVTRLETTFEISFTYDELNTLRTPQQWIEHIASKIHPSGTGACLRQRAFYALRALLMDECALSRKAIVPKTELGTLFPRQDRCRSWEILTEYSGGSLPPLNLSESLEVTSIFVMPGLFILSMLTIHFLWHESYKDATIVALCLIVVFKIFTALTRHHENYFPYGYTRVFHLVNHLVAHTPERFRLPSADSWSMGEIQTFVRAVIMDTLHIDEYHEQWDLFMEYGMS